MIYRLETYYFNHEVEFDFDEAMFITLQAISSWCDSYYAQINVPRKSGIERELSGHIPKTAEAIDRFLSRLYQWMGETTSTTSRFESAHMQFLSGKKAIFSLWDSPYNCHLDVSPDEFDEIKRSWKKNKIPVDFFFPEGRGKSFLKPTGLMRRIFLAFGFDGGSYANFTPKEWEAEPDKEKYQAYESVH